MKVLIVAPIDPFVSMASGVRTYTMNLISHLIRNNITPKLLGVLNSKNINERELEFKFTPVVNKKVSGYIYLMLLFIKAFSLKIDPDTVIHAQRPDHLLPFILLHRHIPKICTLHGAHIKNVYLKKGSFIGHVYEKIEEFVFIHTDKIIMISSETHSYYCEKYPFLADKSINIPNGINLDLFKPIGSNNIAERYGISSGEKVILYVGRLEKEKRVECIIKIFKNMKDELSASKLIIVGDGREKESLQNLVREMNLKDVIFVGNLRYEEVPKIMNCANLLIMCSIHEGMPTVALEALACGLPVVSTNVGDLNHIITNETGHIFKTTNIKEIRNIILEILLNNKMSKNSCVETAKKYSWENICERIVDVYHEVLDKN